MMPDEMVGVLAILGMFLLMALRVHIGLAMVISAGLALLYLRGWSPVAGLLGESAYEMIASWTFSTIPMFLLMGYLIHQAGLTEKLYDAARLWLSRMPGGLAVATVTASGGFAAASGSSLATTIAMGQIAVPQMRRLGYDKGLASGAAAMGGTLGAIIPPSILIVLYAIIVQVPIGPVLIAGFLPGLLSIAMFSGMIILRSKLRPSLVGSMAGAGEGSSIAGGSNGHVLTIESVSWRERFTSLGGAWPVPLMIVIIVGGIYSGIMTATEAGAVAAAVAFLVAVANRSLTVASFSQAVVDAAKFVGVILLILSGATMLTRLLALSGLAQLLSSFIVDLDLSAVALVLVIALMYLILGMFMDTLAMMLLTLPVLLPILNAADVNLIWFGILVVKLMEMGLVTPPFGVAVFVLKGVLGDEYTVPDLFKGVGWYIIADIVTVSLLIAFPVITLLLPNLMGA